MADLQHILRRAARRHLAHRALHRAGFGLLAAAVGGCLLLLADRGWSWGVPGWFYGVAATAGALGGAISAALRRTPPLAMAILLDRTFDLKDRLSTAESIEQAAMRRQDAAFAAMVRRDANRLAGTLDVAAATPVQITRIWGGAASAAVLLALAALFLPSLGWAGQNDAELASQREEALQQERAEIAESIETAIDGLEEDPSLDEPTRREVDALTELASQLTGEGEATNPDAVRDESASRLSELADRLAEQAEKDTAVSDELTRRFAGMDAPEAPMSAEEFAEALKRGEFGEAADLLDEMMRSAETLPEAERRALAEHLRELSRQLEQTGATPDADEKERRAQLEQVLRDQGLDQQAIDDLLEAEDSQDATAEDLREQLEQRDVDEQIARELARDLDEQRRRQEVEEQAQRDAERVAGALDEAAGEIEQPPTEPPDAVDEGDAARPDQPPEATSAEAPQPPPGEQPPDPAPAEGQQEQPPQETGGEQNQQTPKGGERRPEQQTGTERRPPEGSTPPPDQPPPGGEPDGQRRQQEGEKTTGAETQPPPEGAETETGQRATPDGQEPLPTPGQRPETDQPEGGEEQLVTPSTEPPDPSTTAGEPPADGTPPPPEGRTAGEPGAEEQTPGDVIRDLDERRRSAEERRDAARRASDAARRMAENMTEEERQRWAEQWRRELGGAGDGIGDRPASPPLRPDAPENAIEEFDDLDLGGDEEASRLIAEWLGTERPGDRPAGVESAAAGDRVRRARRAAERAVEESVVPSRYHRSIKRYFDRLRETVDKASGAPAAGGDGKTTSTGDRDS